MRKNENFLKCPKFKIVKNVNYVNIYLTFYYFFAMIDSFTIFSFCTVSHPPISTISLFDILQNFKILNFIKIPTNLNIFKIWHFFLAFCDIFNRINLFFDIFKFFPVPYIFQFWNSSRHLIFSNNFQIFPIIMSSHFRNYQHSLKIFVI